MNRRVTDRAASQLRRGLTRAEAQDFVGTSRQCFDQLVVSGQLPAPVELNGEEIFDLVQLDRAMDRLMGLRRSTL